MPWLITYHGLTFCLSIYYSDSAYNIIQSLLSIYVSTEENYSITLGFDYPPYFTCSKAKILIL